MGKLTISDKKITEDRLRLNLTKGKLKFSSTLFKYRDKDTRQIILYVPSLEISGYGIDEKKALEMLNFSMNDFFNVLTKLPHKQIDIELAKLGWKHVQYKNKEYSNSYVDGDGKLNNFNAVADEVEQLTVEA